VQVLSDQVLIDWLPAAAPNCKPAVAESLQVAIEYDPQPPFNSGSPTKADASTLRLALRILMGDRPVRYFTDVSGQAIGARLRRARRALSGRRQSKHSPPQVMH